MVKNKNDILKIEKIIKNNKKCLAMVAPSFVTDFKYPSIINQLKKLGFDKVVELTFGAKMINREYHKKLKKTKELLISSTCPGITLYIEKNFPEYKNNLIRVDSPMIAMAKISKKVYPDHKIFFISPCNFKKIESQTKKEIDYVIDFLQLKELFQKNNINEDNKKAQFDKFYNDYTKIYPLSGGLYHTAHVKRILNRNQVRIIDGISEVNKFLKKPNKNVLFLDCLFCPGGCIGGPYTDQKFTINHKKKLIHKYLKLAKREDIPESKKGLLKCAKGIEFKY
ncbi:MAG: [Fe-Fe] hydrogenase large subunit C-terminal domain-containing protein [Candidatus Pacearchaeota archaeon]